MSIFNALTNVVKAGVAAVAVPVAAVVDVVTLPGSACDPKGKPFDRTAKMAKAVGDCVSEAVKPSKD